MASHPSQTLITNASIVMEDSVLTDGEILLEGDQISWIGLRGSHPELTESFAGTRIDAKQGWIVPGFIDIHVHGGYGHDFMDATKECLDGITRFHSQHGTTSMLATTVTASHEAIVNVLSAVSDYTSQEMPYAQLIGVHLEGPFISHKWPGAQNPAFIVPPQKQWLQEWSEQYPGLIKMLTLAPETEGAYELIQWLKSNGVVAAAGHTDASYDIVEEAVEHGLSHAVHTFNAMTGLHHRKPGTVGAVLTDDRISAEIIADGFHVHPAGIKLLTRAKVNHNLMLITDAMSAAGLGNGQYSLGGLPVTVKDGVATLTEGNSLAGSTLTMISAFRFVIDKVGLTVPEASVLASGNPARMLGMYDTIGSIAAGKQADVLLLTPELEIGGMWIKGKQTV
ncbi:N-acetylglucosamine-6-phosphate deacetylase [Paenibacillus sp. J2TS4]|uniref:N-acetylglucosamine-6-phosphate deacetylase n=1 Tax=Paenibacillus sp. J2TS4 TaxID=2807194 RepID=UPI001B250B83|nr:N-acetylglucosamine-6-phosphate deacetylase [Paenibacillus sp. J2TS4]GIP32735.1 N-acetylglucosamine-6-phosphate deacetylase [Paenibacillus sp. J2TS4]